MGRRFKSLLCLLALLAFTPLLQAQKTARRILYKKVPEYPPALKQAHIGGIVRLQIVISPRGSVGLVVPIGGNAALVESATRAVKKWKYAAADSEMKTQIEFVFDPAD